MAALEGGVCRCELYIKTGFDNNVKFDNMLNRLQRFRTGARALSLKARTVAYKSDAPTAMSCILTSLALLQSVRDEPLLASHLIGCALHAFAYKTAQDLLLHARFSDEQLMEL